MKHRSNAGVLRTSSSFVAVLTVHFFTCVQVLVFSHKVRMLRIIQKMMTAKGYAYVVLDGSTPQARSLQHRHP